MSHSIKEAYGRPTSSRKGLGKGFGSGSVYMLKGVVRGTTHARIPADCSTPFDMPGFVRMDAAVYYRPELFHRTNLLAAILSNFRSRLLTRSRFWW
jgi:hypothetical protein